MISVPLILVACVPLGLGATLYAYAKNDGQELLGMIMMSLGVLFGLFGGLFWWTGL